MITFQQTSGGVYKKGFPTAGAVPTKLQQNAISLILAIRIWLGHVLADICGIELGLSGTEADHLRKADRNISRARPQRGRCSACRQLLLLMAHTCWSLPLDSGISI